jgi:hypothetical protein
MGEFYQQIIDRRVHTFEILNRNRRIIAYRELPIIELLREERKGSIGEYVCLGAIVAFVLPAMLTEEIARKLKLSRLEE